MLQPVSPFWRRQVFWWVLIGSVLFVPLTAIAMWFYPGGNYNDPNTLGYSFFTNFFSELGRLHSRQGEPQYISAGLFFMALVMAGSGLILFFLAFPQFFVGKHSNERLSRLGTVLGVAAGLCFIGVAFTPVDVFRPAHIEFVKWAFRAFPLAVACYTIVIFRHTAYPQRFAWLFVGFGVLLVAYLLLLEFGPEVTTPDGLLIQATGQKLIVYASILSVGAQAWGALKLKPPTSP